MFQPKHIVCPTDFSDYSFSAIRYADILAKKYEAKITLLHVDETESLPYIAHARDSEAVQSLRDKARSFAEQQFDWIRRELISPDTPVESKLLCGRAYKIIIEEADSQQYDLMVISRKGLTKLPPSLIGSTAERIVRFARCPVMSFGEISFDKEFVIRNILLPTDFSECSFAALEYAFSLARVFNANIYWLYTEKLEGETKKNPMSNFPDPKKYYKKAHEVVYEMVVDKDVEPSNSIIRFEQNYDIDLIVMGTHGKKGIRRVFIGNNTAEVVRQATCPVLTVTHPMHRMLFSRSALNEFNHETEEREP